MAEVIVVNLLESVIGYIIWIGIKIPLIKIEGEPFSLAIECVNLMIIVIVKGLVREVLFRALYAELVGLDF